MNKSQTLQDSRFFLETNIYDVILTVFYAKLTFLLLSV